MYSQFNVPLFPLLTTTCYYMLHVSLIISSWAFFPQKRGSCWRLPLKTQRRLWALSDWRSLRVWNATCCLKKARQSAPPLLQIAALQCTVNWWAQNQSPGRVQHRWVSTRVGNYSTFLSVFWNMTVKIQNKKSLMDHTPEWALWLYPHHEISLGRVACHKRSEN